MDDVRAWRAPGRVNLIGEHLDYNGGPSVPFAVDRGIALRVRRRDDQVVNVWSTLPDGSRERATFEVTTTPGDVDGWAGYVAGAVWAWREGRGEAGGGVDLVLESDLPTGAGLSSSAALTVGVVAALDELADGGLGPADVARTAQRAENDYVGAPTGLMDQLAVTFGREGEVLVTEPFADDPVTRRAPFDPTSAGLSLLVLGTGVGHEHATGGYARRREECAEAARLLDVEHLAAVGLDGLVRLEDPVLRRRVQHVLTETARVKAALRALGEADWSQLGTVLTASHVSLRDDFEVSCAELDVAVEAALEAGALGARMTGGGFGGSAIALVPQPKAGPVRELVEQRFDALGWARPDVFAVRPAQGVHRTA